MLLSWTIATLFVALALGQDEDSSSTTGTPTSTEDWPVKTIFLPIDLPNNLAASVITAAPNATAYALGCLSTTTDQACPGLDPPQTLTEGESTLIYTMPDEDNAGATIRCELRGGTLATAATCNGRSPISGLGDLLTSSTLAEQQVTYATVAITAGAEKLTEFDKGERWPATSSMSGGGAAVATEAPWRVGVAAAAVGLGAVL